MDEITRSLCAGANIAHFATTMAGGSPQVAAVWLGLRDDRLVIVKEQKSVAYRNVKRDPRVAISIVAADSPYRAAHIRGRVVDICDDEEARRVLDELSLEYTGRPYPVMVPSPMSALFIKVDHARGFDFSELHATSSS